MAKDRTFEEIRKENERKRMASALETARSFIKPIPRTSRIRRYGSGQDEVSEAWERANDFLAKERDG